MESRIQRRRSQIEAGTRLSCCSDFTSNEYTLDFCLNCGNHKVEHNMGSLLDSSVCIYWFNLLEVLILTYFHILLSYQSFTKEQQHIREPLNGRKFRPCQSKSVDRRDDGRAEVSAHSSTDSSWCDVIEEEVLTSHVWFPFLYLHLSESGVTFSLIFYQYSFLITKSIPG